MNAVSDWSRAPKPKVVVKPVFLSWRDKIGVNKMASENTVKRNTARPVQRVWNPVKVQSCKTLSKN